MTKGTPTRIFAACMGLSAFGIAVFSGLIVDNPSDIILARAILAMAVCFVVGSVLGAAGERAIADHLDTRARRLAAQALESRKPAKPARPAQADEPEPIVV